MSIVQKSEKAINAQESIMLSGLFWNELICHACIMTNCKMCALWCSQGIVDGQTTDELRSQNPCSDRWANISSLSS